MNWFQFALNIRKGTDFKNTPSSITENISIKGANAWMMVCSALLASIGLDTNSTAVIIGAMLISPLMSPILGVGYSVAVHDRELFIRASRNLGYATGFSLLASIIYFMVTPLGEPTSEILSRTQPTLLDVGVAFFGGVAGIVSGSRQEKSNAIPGVAIATALMPPLSAAGFGLARGHWEIFAGAFYLFFINAVFIALSTYLIVRMLRFPFKQYVEAETQKKVSRAALAILLLITAPSIWFLYTVYERGKVKRNIQTEIIDDFERRGNEILKWEIADKDSVKIVKTFFSGQPVSDQDVAYYDSKLRDAGLKHYRINFFRMNMSRNEMDKMSSDMMDNIMKTIELQNVRLKDSLAGLVVRNEDDGLFTDVHSFYPGLHSIGCSPTYLQGKDRIDTLWTAQVIWDSSSNINYAEAENRIQEYLRKRYHTDTVLMYSRVYPRQKK